VPDWKKLHPDLKVAKSTFIEEVNGEPVLEFVKKNITKVENIYFAGGEPLIMDEHYRVLNMLIENNIFNCRLYYNTNMSTLTYKEYNVLDYWKKFTRLTIGVSIDEIGERAELIRKGTIWTNTDANLRQLVAENIFINPCITVGAQNVFRLPEIITYFKDIGALKPEWEYKNFTFNLIYGPECYVITALPDEIKAQTKEKILAFIQNYKEKYNVDITDKFTQVFSFLNSPHVPKYRELFIHYTKSLDEIRNENTYEVIPELKCML
jgi:hypothetical protein